MEACLPKSPPPQNSQADKFREAAREHEADEDEARWEERLRKIAKHKREKPE
jgi:hypothetical protein